MAEKDTRVVSIKSQIKRSLLTEEEQAFIDGYLHHYNHIKFAYTSLIQKNPGLFKEKKISELKQLCDRDNILPYRVFNAGLVQQVNGQIASQLSNKKRYLAETEERLKETEKRLKKQENTIKLIQSMGASLRNLPVNRQRFSRTMKLKIILENKAERQKNRISHLKREIDNNMTKICYGSSSLLKKRNHIHTNDRDKLLRWRKEWNAARYGSMLFCGSSDETMGNSNANITTDGNNGFLLNITVPESLRHKYSFVRVSVPIKIAYYKQEILEHIAYHSGGKKAFQYSKKEKRQAKEEGRKLIVPTSSLSVRIMRNVRGDFDVVVGLQSSLHMKPELKTHEKYGVIGVDINPDHLDVAETDAKGNLIKGWSVPLDLKDKSTKQRKTILSQTTKGIADYALSKGKSIVLEDLDFSKKRQELRKGVTPAYSRMLSAFAYGKIKEYFYSQSWKAGVRVIYVNPAWTSFIGNIKYAMRIGKAKHEHVPAAYVIARRGQGFKERIPEKIIRVLHTTINKKNKNSTESCLTAELISHKAMVFDISSTTSRAELIRFQKAVFTKKAYPQILNEKCFSGSTRIRRILTGVPLFHSIFISHRFHDQISIY